jgi:predicted dehydrogenase
LSTTPNNSGLTRRDVLKATAGLAAASVLAGVGLPSVHAGEGNTIQLAIVGCGGRGTGALGDALRTQAKQGPIKLVAMADVFKDRLEGSYKSISGSEFAKQVDVPADRQFIGFDAYKKAMDCLKPGDVVILTTPPAFRWVHFTHAIDKGLNVFMEKPVTVDGPGSVKMLKLGEDSVKKNLKVGVGLMCRHCEARGELYKRIKDGAIGDLFLVRAARMQGPEATCFSDPKPANVSELEYQIRRFHSFLWASGGSYSDFLIHNIDECCWMKDAWPVKAHATGGRHYRGNKIDQNFDHYAVEYTFADGAKLRLEGRTMPDCDQEFSSHAWGTKGSAVISQSSHFPAKCRTYKGWNLNVKDDLVWRYEKDEPSPYHLEWEALIDAIRNDKPYNEVERGTKASIVTSMGRMASHTGDIVTFDQMLNSEHEFAPGLDKLTLDSAAPLVADKEGKYPVPMPGKAPTGFKGRREFYVG